MLVAWVLFPVILAGICLGCGLLLEVLVGRRLPGLLLAPAGFATVVVVASIATASSVTASLATPVTVALAVAGLGLSFPWRGRRVEPWALAAALAVFAVYAAPIVLSGNPTFAGYIKLDDTATWMAFVDRLMQHGRDLSGLPLSTYARTLSVNFPGGYPVGAFLPLGVGTQLSGDDVAWLVQPYMATMAAMLTLCLAWLARPLVDSPRLRALVAFGAAQPALLYGYSLWGGVKEVAVALCLAAFAALAVLAARSEEGWRGSLPAAVLAAALLTMLGAGAAVWIVPIFGLVAIAFWRAAGGRALLRRAVPPALAVAVLAVPVLLAAGAFSPTQGGLTNASELGNLLRPLHLVQYFGIWPNGDFRLDPDNGAVTGLLIALAVAAALAGAWFAWRKRAAEPLVYAVGVGAGSLAVFLYASPWVGAKALASAGPSFLLLALAGALVFAARVERVLGLTVLAAILAGVLWSNVLAYHDVSLAPYGQLAELESIGHEIAGQGPTLMTEYNPYGARHFLREGDGEGASELRYREVTLRDGSTPQTGEWVDTDRISLPELLTYRTLVLRRNPAQSRPPSVYSLLRSDRWYEVWQRPEGVGAGIIAAQLPLGTSFDPAAVPSCGEVLRLAREAGPRGRLAAVIRRPNLVVSLAESRYPASWVPTEPGSPDLVPTGPGTAGATFVAPGPGRYEAYVGGNARNRLSLSVDGRPAGSVEAQLNEAGQYLYMGATRLATGVHTLDLTYAGQSLAPGSGGPPLPIGPIVFSAAGADPPVTYLPPARAHDLCGKSLDWVEALRG